MTASTPALRTLDGNEAVANVAYRLSEVVAIYPITPASPMGEHADDWAALRRPNLWGSVPEIIEMQSEGGAAGAVHGALQAGALVTTFTASQGLLLMLPTLFKIAGELTPFCLHVAARSIATHALSIFGDHSDVMAARGTGFALLASGSVQEAHDFAALGHAATLASRVPVLHFFDGFRTSHEIAKISMLSDDDLAHLIALQWIADHRDRRLNPERPIIRGTSQNPDAFFQAREATNSFYDDFPDRLDELFRAFERLTGRAYQLFEYHGHPEADRVVVLMGSGAECVHETVDWLLAQGERVGVLKVRLFRPFSARRFLGSLPATVRHLAVLDRTKEPGATGEPLLLEVCGALIEALTRGERSQLPRVIGGRYGLSSKEFTPAMARAVFTELQREKPKTRFTVGIRDDVTHLSLDVDASFEIEPDDVVRALFYGLGSDGTVSSNKASIKIIGEKANRFAQGYFVYDSKKSGSTTVSHLRFSPRPIRSSYQIRRANFVAIHDPGFLDRLDVLERARDGAVVLLNTSVPANLVWESFPREVQDTLLARRCRLYAIDAYAVAEKAGLGRRINTVMQACFFALAGVLPVDQALDEIKKSIAATWGKRGPEIVRRNVAAVDSAVAGLYEIVLPAQATATRQRRPSVPESAPDFVQRLTRLLLEGHGDQLPVSAFPPDGTWPTGTSRFEKRAIALEIPIWEPDLCVQCNHCAMICPHAAIRAKVYDLKELGGNPAGLLTRPEEFGADLTGLHYTIQVAPDDCTGCGLCVAVCPAKDRTQPRRKSINMRPADEHRAVEQRRFAAFESLPDAPRSRIPVKARSLPLLPPLFEFSGACAGCGETPYIRLLTQLVGDRLLIANATGCSSIYGGNLPTTPYTTNQEGRGPAWNNSLFENAAELGLGMRLGVDFIAQRAERLVTQLAAQLPEALVTTLRTRCDPQNPMEIDLRRQAQTALRAAIAQIDSPSARELEWIAGALVPQSVWVIGGDGWAYDIGYGGLDHVLAAGRCVKLLVLDTEVYSNTGGQQSKATPLGAVAKFASSGKATRKKDLGLLAMSYGHVYVAAVGMQARPDQTVTAFAEAESYPGPALIIAHSPCIAHGYDLVHSPTHQRRAIDSWAWPLYRFDPRRIALGLPPLQLDSPHKKLPMRRFMEEEARFRMVELRDQDRYEQLVRAAEQAAGERRSLYLQLAGIHLDPSTPSEGLGHG